jgi:signal transduction histidine kinase
MDFFHTLATEAAISIDNARLLETTRQVLNETNALYRITQGLAKAVTPNELMKDVIDLLQKNFGYHHVQIYITDPQSYDLLFKEGSGEIGSRLKQQGYLLPAGSGIVGHVAETGQPFITDDVDQVIFSNPNPLLPEMKSQMAVPIKIQNKVMGILDIHHKTPGYLDEHHLQLMSTVADQLAVALHKAKMYEDLQHSLSQEKAMRAQLMQSERLSVMGRLLASVSHELNNPLQAIQNALYLLKEENGLTEQGRQDLDIVLSESERMAALIERLRATYRPSRLEDFQPVDLNALVEDVYALLATHLRHNEIAFEFLPDPELPSVPGLTDQLRQVLINLSMNAVEAMKKGGRLCVSTRYLPDTEEGLVTVTDNGLGIDDEILPYVFEAFTTNKSKGTGLGLTISYDIIRRHRGRIKAENNPEGGATFSIWLPIRVKETDEDHQPYPDHR